MGGPADMEVDEPDYEDLSAAYTVNNGPALKCTQLLS